MSTITSPPDSPSRVATAEARNAPMPDAAPAAERKRLLGFLGFTAGLSLVFIQPLGGLIRYALHTPLHSHALLIPFISVYLIWLQRHAPRPRAGSSPALAVLPLAVGLVALRAWLFPASPPATWPLNDYLALTTFTYLCLFWSGALLLLGGRWLRAHLFATLFLVFLVPLPTAWENALEVFFQYTSAEAAAFLFAITGSTVFRTGLTFQLPGITLQVAQECSGIRSSLVLFITSLLAGHMFLRSSWRRVLLALVVIPLGIVRNGFRIYVIAWLCVHISPSMIDSIIHRQGGPLFFALSLIPFFLLLLGLHWSERGQRRAASVRATAAPPEPGASN